MKAFKTGFIGYGNMAGAIVKGIADNEILQPGDIYLYDKDSNKVSGAVHYHICDSVEQLAELAQIIFLCVKPNQIPEALAKIKTPDRAFVSIAAGIKASKIVSSLSAPARVMRVMPNTPLLVGQGAVCVQIPNDFSAEESAFVHHIFNTLGTVKEVAENQMDAVTGVSGSGPAYVYLFIDALARAGEANGLQYNDALDLAVQTFTGAAEMLRKTGGNPEELIRAVCSPGGTTIEAMKVFEREDVRGIIQEAVDACVERAGELSAE